MYVAKQRGIPHLNLSSGSAACLSGVGRGEVEGVGVKIDLANLPNCLHKIDQKEALKLSLPGGHVLATGGGGGRGVRGCPNPDLSQLQLLPPLPRLIS
jgi:hypothetical protein